MCTHKHNESLRTNQANMNLNNDPSNQPFSCLNSSRAVLALNASIEPTNALSLQVSLLMAEYLPVPNIDTDLDMGKDHVVTFAASPQKPSLNVSMTVQDDEPKDTIPKFIKIIGTPPAPSDERVGENNVVLPSIAPTVIMDVLDAENEDPFTLETLDSLIELHAEKGLDFIIARVTTVDPNEETRFYYSYYAAHHINKVLFRTQPEEGLLHRMKAKNPLNNMTIVGDVHYYVVKAESVQRKPKKPMSAVPKSPYDVLKMMIPQTDTQIRNANIRNHFRSKTGDSAEGFGGLTQLLNITTGQSVPLQFVINNNAFENEEFELQERLRNAKGSKPGEFSVESRRNSFDDAYSDMSPIVRPSTTIKLNMPKDTENRHRPVRSNAFANERTNSMSIDDWIRLQKQKLPSNVPKSAFVGSTISEKIPTVSSPRRRSQRTETTTPTPTVTFAEEKTDELYYEAHYHSSDDDFLLHGNIRSYFKKNALESSDSILFTIATNNTSSQLPPGDVHAHPTLANLSFLLGEEDGEAFAILKRNKFLKWLILGYIAMAIFVVRFLVPPSHAYIVGLTFFFFFCLFLIITL